jgi:hypothetical protein
VEKRRRTVRQPVGALIALAAFAGATQACELPPGTRVESQRVALSYRTIPARIAVGEQFVLELTACPKNATALPERVKLDAQMPEHRHGMNYRPSLQPMGGGRYRSEGWLFHMPGRWEFIFDLGGERLTHSVRIE